MNALPLFVVTLVTVVVGLAGKRGRAYWARGAAAIAVAVAMTFLGSVSATPDDPTGDGLVTSWVREASNDGPLVAIWGIAMLVVGYGVIIYLLVTGVRRDRANLDANDRPA